MICLYGGRLGAMSASGAADEELRGAGLRVTAARVALLETVREGDHLSVEAIAAGVRDRIGHVSLQAVYEALHALTAARRIRRIGAVGEAPCLTASDDQGFIIDEAEVTYWGLCPACSTARTT